MAHAQSGNVAPTVVNVTSPMPDGVYGAGSAINVTVVFSEPVVWRPSDAAQPPRLALDMGGEERLAAYASGNGTSQLNFTYTVRAGDSEDDLDYRGAGALAGEIEDTSGTAAVLALQPPGTAGWLGHSRDILVDHAAPVLVANGSAATGLNGYLNGIDAFYVGDKAYALTGGLHGDLYLYRVQEDGTLVQTDHVTDGTDRTSAGLGNFTALTRIWDVAAFDLNGSTHAVLASPRESALTLVRVHGNGTLEARGTTPIRGPHGIDVLDLGGRPHVLVSLYGAGEFHLLRIHDNGTMEARSNVTSPAIPINWAVDAEAFEMNGAMHAIVASTGPENSSHAGRPDDPDDSFIHLVRIPDSGVLEYESGWRLNSSSELALYGPVDVKAFYMDGRPHALVTAGISVGVQLVRVHWNGTLQGMGRLLDGDGGLALGSIQIASVFNGSGGGTYAVIAAQGDSSLSLIRVRGDGALLPAGSVTSGSPGFDQITNVYGVDTFDLGGITRAISGEFNPYTGLQLTRMSAASPTNVTAAAGTYGTGEAIYISVLFDRAVEAAGPLEIVLDSGGRASYVSGNGTRTLVFRHVVGPDDPTVAALGYAGVNALRAGPGGSITVSGAPGTHAAAALPPPGSPRSLSGSAEVSVVAAPSVKSVSSPTAAGPHGTGRTILVNVTFDEAVTVDTSSGSPLLELATGGGGGSGANATYAPDMSGGPTLMFSYAVRQGDAAADLDYTGGAALSAGGALIRDRDGNAANLALPDPGADGLLDAGALELETVMPRVESVASRQEGAYGAGRTILVNVTFSEPVDVAGAPRLGLDLEAGGAAGHRHASYSAGSGAASIQFAYIVRNGDFAPNLGYAGQGALALNGGSIRDAAGNAANLTLPGPEGGGPLLGAGRILEVDGRPPPAVLSVSSPNASETYRAGDTIHVHVNFSKSVFVAGGPVLLGLETGRIDRNATYASGNGTDGLVFAYTVRQGDSSPGLVYAGPNALALNGGTVRDSVGGAADLTLPDPDGGGPLPGGGGAIVVDTTPYVVSVSSGGPGRAYGLGDLLRIEVEFDADVNVTGAPELGLETGSNTGRSAAFERMGDAGTTLVFNYTVGPGDRTDGLGYAGAGALSGTITDVLGNPASLALPDPAGPGGSLSMDGAPLAVDHAAPVLIPAGSVANGTGGFDRLHEAQAVSAFKINGTQYLLAGFNGLQLIRVHENGTMEAAGSAANGTNGFDALGGTHGIEAFEMGGGAYAIVASASDLAGEYNSVQLVRVHGGNGTLEAKGSLKKADDASLMLGGAFDVEVFEMGPANHTYALVSAADDDGLQLIRVHENGTLEAAGSARDAARSGGAVAGLDRPYRIDAFRAGDGSVRALVTAYGNDSVHLFDVAPGSLAGAARAGDGSAGFRLDNPAAVAVLESVGGEGRALVATHADFLQLVRVRGGAIEAVSSAEDGARGFSELDDGHAIAVLGGRGGSNATYALVTADGDGDNAPGGVQLARVLGDGTLLAAGSASSRDAGLGLLDRPAGADTFDLGGRRHAAVASEAGHSVTLIRLARTSVTSVGATTAGSAYAAGSPVNIAVNFDGNVSFSAGGPEPVLRLDVGGSQRTAAYAGGNGSSSLRFGYTVQPGDNAVLAYAGVAALEGDIRDADGHLADATLPAPGSPSSLSGPARVALDTLGPRVLSVASPNATESGPAAAAPLGIGGAIHVAVTFSEPVFVDTASGTPTIALEVGGAGRNATYASGSGSAVLVFTYPVMPGDGMSLGLDHSGRPISPNGGTIEDEAGNRADLALPAPTGSLVAGLDGAPPRVVGVSSPTAAGAYMAGEAILVNVTFSEDVAVEGGPLLGLAAGAAGRNATYASGSGSPSLLFRYVVQDGDAAADLGYAGAGALDLNGGSIRDAAGNPASLELPAPGSPGSLSGSASIVLDTAAPRVEYVASPAPPDRVHRAGERITVSVSFDEAVSPSPGAPPPVLLLDVGGSPAEAAYDPAASAASSLAFAYTVRTGDLEDGLAYYNASALSGAVADAAGNPANLTLPEPGSPASLSGSSRIRVDGTLPALASASAVFTGPGTVRIDYGAPLGPPDGHEGAVYGGVAVDGEDGERPVSSVTGMGTRAHAVAFGGAGVGDAQTGSIRLLVSLEGEEGGARHEFPAGSIRIAAGASARTLSPPPGDPSPVAPIEDDGFVRAVNATAAGDAARPAINVSGLPAPDGAPARGPRAVVMPGGIVSIVASFAEVSFPPNATASPVPADGLFKLYLSPRPPAAQDVADGFMVPAGGVEVLVVVEVGDNATRITFDMPVRILLRGMANGSAFYVNGTGGGGGAVVPILAECDAVDTFGEVHERLGGAGECWLDSGPDKVIYTYHLTRFGAAEAPPGMCAARVEASPIDFERIGAGGRSSVKDQRVESTGSLPLGEVTIRATDWARADDGSTAMPANATQVRTAGDAAWRPLDGEVGAALDEGGMSASVQFRVDIPAGALPGAAAAAAVQVVQTVTYTVSCVDAPG